MAAGSSQGSQAGRALEVSGVRRGRGRWGIWSPGVGELGNPWREEKEGGSRGAVGGWWQHRGTWQAQGVLGGACGITQGTECLGTGGTAPPDGLWTQVCRCGGLSMTWEVEPSCSGASQGYPAEGQVEGSSPAHGAWCQHSPQQRWETGSSCGALSAVAGSLADGNYSWCLPADYLDFSCLGSSASSSLQGHFSATRCSPLARGLPFALSSG